MDNSRSENCFYKQGGMGRSFLETAVSLPRRVLGRLRVEDMATEEKDFAHFSEEVYKKPNHRQTTLRGYTLLQTEIPGREGPMPLNDKRWGVYRAPNGINHVLVFRGTADLEDVGHDIDLCGGFGEHEYTMDAAVWSLRVILFFAEQHADRRHNGESDDEACLKFRVAGHSLGGAVAMGVILHLHDIPLVAQHLEGDASTRNHYSDVANFKREIVDPWKDTTSRSETMPLYELCGGHVFNPGAWPRDLNRDFATLRTVASDIRGGKYVSLLHLFLRPPEARNSHDVYKRVTTHHILGDLVSCCYRMGDEKSYLPKNKAGSVLAWRPHRMENFL